MGMCSNTSAMEGTRPGARPGPEVSFAPFPLLPPASSPPPLHHSITPPHEILCNFSRPFPLYGVEASGLPAKAIERNGLNVKQDHRTSETQLHSRKERMERSADIPVRQPRSPASARGPTGMPVGRQRTWRTGMSALPWLRLRSPACIACSP